MASSFGKILRMRRMPKIHRKIAYGPARGGTTEYEHQFYYERNIEPLRTKLIRLTNETEHVFYKMGRAVVHTPVLTCRPKSSWVPYPVRCGLFGRRLEHNYIIGDTDDRNKPRT